MLIRFTSPMTWSDPAAEARLKDIIAGMRAAGVIDMFERIVAHVWKVNVDRFEPSEIGDTNRSLGITATENIRTLVLRESWTASNPAGLGNRVHVTAPNDSLLVEAAGARLRVMKCPPAITLSEPRWDTDFRWQAESDVRLEAAAANAAVCNQFLAVPGGLFENMEQPAEWAAQLREVILVWAGGSNNPLTGGWIGLPTVGDRPWLAVQSVWRHGTGATTSGERDSDAPVSDVFSEKDAPSPVVSLKQRSNRARR
ncbi:MAG TPA: hypothetical protein VEM58_02175 [Streptosporangiaceae bacterium]|nr:hypothetical protein [Streptosporangiaceae bacterium]